MAKTLMLLVLVVSVAVAQESPHGKIKLECSTCHATDSWEMKKDPTFNHATTGFALTGQHRLVQCASCHKGLKFDTKMDQNCTSCHTDIHKAELGPNCLRCHSTQSWQVTDMIQKHQQTRFPLLGRHSTISCQSCHVRAAEHQFIGTPTECVSCHRDEFKATISPDHSAAGFSTDCVQCHKVTALTWGGGFNHNLTSFPLTGSHTAVACVSCHQNQVFKGTPSQCVACHQSDFSTSTNPNHAAANFATDCQTCHTTQRWQGALYDHNVTRFPLTGAHRQARCQSCHGDNVFTGKTMGCVSCHLADFTATRNPNHVSGGFPQQCQTCHTTTRWQPAQFDHNATGFPLTGAHVGRSCQSCHVNNNYQLQYTDCYQCHASDFQQPINPNHVSANFSHDCTQCHAMTVWRPSTFNHATTLFPLTGAHTTATCQSCHTNGNYQLVYTDCYQCHQSDFQQTTNPNHVAGNFSHDCTQCHSTTGWGGGSFDHSTTNFPLTGAHQAVTCQTCHVNGNYQLQYTDCYQCHQSNFQQSTNPNHVTGNFSHDCTQCHTSTAWSPATFNHSTTDFPLTGAHSAAACQTCHVNGNYQLQYTDCYQCHQSDFQQVTNPNHVSQVFPHDCTPCHSTTAWIPNTMNHDAQYFRIYSGKHRGKWSACSECHPSIGNFADFTCLSCHEHNRTDMDSKHQGRQGYVYASPSCYECHRGA